jgi:hypothetical protein
VLPAPLAVADAAFVVGPFTATLHGQVNPNGQDMHYYFEYGASTAYRQRAPAVDIDAGPGGSPVSVSAPVSGLSPGTLYHFRLVAVSAGGTSRSSDLTFTTSEGCRDNEGPISRFASRHTVLTHHALVAVGHTTDQGGCTSDILDRRDRGGVERVTISIERQTSLEGLGRCRPLLASMRWGAPRDCKKWAFYFTAHGASQWTLKLKLHLPPGLYRLFAMGYDLRGNREPIDPEKRNGTFIRLR